VTTLRPTRYGAVGLIVASVVITGAALIKTMFEGKDVFASLIVGIVSIAATSLFAFVFVRNARLDLGSDNIRITNVLGVTRELPRTSLGRIVLAPAITRLVSSDSELFVVMDVSGQPFARLNMVFWNAEELETASAQYGDLLDVHSTPIPAKEFNARYPRALPYGARHPWLTLGWIFLVIAALAIAAAAFFSSLG